MGTGGRKDRGQGSHQGLYSEVSQAWIWILALLLIHRMASGRWINFWVPWSLNDRKYTSPTEVSWDYLFCWACIFLIFCYVSKAMAPHFSTLAWKIPWTEEPSRLQSMGSLRVGHNWATSLSLFTFMHWRRTWQPTPVFLPGESQGQGSLVGCRLWGRTESDMTEVT